MSVSCAEVIGNPITHALVYHLVYDLANPALSSGSELVACEHRELMELLTR